MTPTAPARSTPSALAAWLVAAVLAIVGFGAWYVFYHDTDSGPDAGVEQDAAPQPPETDDLAAKRALVNTLPYFALIFLVFLVGSYVMVKVGRGVLARRDRRGQSKYVDAWSAYRLSDEELASASQQLGEDAPPGDEPPADEDSPQPPQ